MALPNPTKSRTWDLGTSANGTFFDTEFNQLYENDTDLDDRLTIVEGAAEFFAHTYAGYGSTDDKIPYFTTVVRNTIAAFVTVVNNATNGLRFTVAQDGIYCLTYWWNFSTGDAMGISVDSAQLTTSISGINAANRQALETGPSSGESACVSVTMPLLAGQVIRPHNGGSAAGTGAQCGVQLTLIKAL